MYVKYATDGLVLSVRHVGDNDVLAVLFTREFGLLYARAGAARRENSKMRCALVLGAQVHVALIQGKAGWRVVGIQSLERNLELKAYDVFGRVAKLVERLVQGEENNEYLFETLQACRHALREGSPDSYGTIELLVVARVLYALGYLSSEALGSALFAHTTIGINERAQVTQEKEKILGAINSALSASQL